MTTSRPAPKTALANQPLQTASAALRQNGPCGGIHLQGATGQDIEAAQRDFLARLEALALHRYVEIAQGTNAGSHFVEFRLRPELAEAWMPGFDTMDLCRRLGLDTQSNPDDLEREILLAMLVSPVPFRFPSHAELAASVRIRKNIVDAARKTSLDFHTTEAERPEDCWRYTDGCGFTLLPGRSLITALKKATQPDESGMRYSFSCYRATEYVILLGIAQELAASNPPLLDKLQRLWESRPIMSGKFHDVFLHEYGSLRDPLPFKYFVPGGRTWFRNPDAHSSDVTGYEGSWVMYLGDGLFTNFWHPDRPYTVTTKCLEIFHWRHATYRDQAGELQVDDALAERLVDASMRDPKERDRILQTMLRLREPAGVYVDGGCIDASREYPRCVCPGTSDLALPDPDDG
ncbi:MAG: hypothetical protein ACTHKB_12480 [Burkholderiaceae bacterium]